MRQVDHDGNEEADKLARQGLQQHHPEIESICSYMGHRVEQYQQFMIRVQSRRAHQRNLSRSHE